MQRIIDEQPEILGSDWTLEEGLKVLQEALDGQSGDSQKKIAELGLQLTCMLIYKNRNYGDSALNPLYVFSRNLSRRDGMHVRMDDKISRIARGENIIDDMENPAIDLAGYIVLDAIAAWEDRQEV